MTTGYELQLSPAWCCPDPTRSTTAKQGKGKTIHAHCANDLTATLKDVFYAFAEAQRMLELQLGKPVCTQGMSALIISCRYEKQDNTVS